MVKKWFKKHKTAPTPQDRPTTSPSETGEQTPQSPSTEQTGNAVARSNPSDDYLKPTDSRSSGTLTGDSPTGEGEAASTGGIFNRLRKGLSKTRRILTTDIDALFLGKHHLDDDLLEEMEELLITADLGVQTTMDLIDVIRKKSSQIEDGQTLKQHLKKAILTLLTTHPQASYTTASAPHVIMVVGVNGVGKTTTIGKLAAQYRQSGKKVLLTAADTFRAAAIEQLTIWAERARAEIVKHKDGADPAAVVFDGIEAALARKTDVVLIDTAGRLHTKINLMEELKKIKRTVSKKIPAAPHEILLVLDATTGQNALSQAKLFNEALGVTGVALTKLDGTAKGGIVISIASTFDIPLKYLGVGEAIADLQHFDQHRFVDALF